eukprot:gene18614-24345_t
MREAAFYKAKNLKWTAEYFKSIVDAHANAILDLDIIPTDKIAIWLPDKAEKHVALLAAVHSGVTVIDVDQDAIQTVEDLRQFLKIAKCRAIYFDVTTSSLSCINLLRKAIPEFFYYDDTKGQYFHSKHFPELKYFIHTGFDLEMGCINFKNLYITDPLLKNNLAIVADEITDDTPAYAKAIKGSNGWEIGPIVTHKSLGDIPSFYFAKNLIQQEYFEGI